MANTSKSMSDRDGNQTLMLSFNNVDATLSIADKWVSAVVGRRITTTITTTSVANDTIRTVYSEGANTLFTIDDVYTSGARTQISYTTRIS